MADTIEDVIKELKTLRKKYDDLVAKGADTSALSERMEKVEQRLERDPNFKSWDD